VVTLRPASTGDKLRVYQWLAQSDATVSMMGPPLYPELPVTSWKEFCDDYGDFYFDGSKPLEGRCFIIETGGRDIGVICHNRVFPELGSTDLDIWLRSSDDFGRGYGTVALRTLVDRLSRELSLDRFVIYTSRRNPRAIAAYLKAGFREITRTEAAEIIEFTEEDLDYRDGVFLGLVQGGGCGALPAEREHG